VLQCYSQELRFEHLSSENGLSNNTVRCIFQDKKGFIWIGTEDGLNQFDGYTVTVFKNKISDSASLSDNFISQIYEDKLGRFWIATAAGGLNLFNRETGKFKRYKTKTGDPNSLANNTVVQVFEDSSDKLWVLCTNGKLCLYQPKSDNFKRIELPIFGTVREFPAPLVYEDKQHYFWIAGNNGLCKYSHQTGDIKKYLPQPNSHLEVSNRVRMIIPKTDSVFYVTVDNLLLEFNKVTEAFTIVKNALAEYVAHFQILYIKDDQSC
jgi:ligand-binding sensor domain-containing protein